MFMIIFVCSLSRWESKDCQSGVVSLPGFPWSPCWPSPPRGCRRFSPGNSSTRDKRGTSLWGAVFRIRKFLGLPDLVPDPSTKPKKEPWFQVSAVLWILWTQGYKCTIPTSSKISKNYFLFASWNWKPLTKRAGSGSSQNVTDPE
jgi:hypothetical protein